MVVFAFMHYYIIFHINNCKPRGKIGPDFYLLKRNCIDYALCEILEMKLVLFWTSSFLSSVFF